MEIYIMELKINKSINCIKYVVIYVKIDHINIIVFMLFLNKLSLFVKVIYYYVLD